MDPGLLDSSNDGDAVGICDGEDLCVDGGNEDVDNDGVCDSEDSCLLDSNNDAL